MIRQKIPLDNRSHDSFKNLFDRLKAEPVGVYEVYVCDKKRTRSKKQRGYYFSVIVSMISEHTGFTRDETNEVLKFKFNKREVEMPDGSFIKVGRSIEKMPPKEVERIQEQIRIWAAQEMDLIIPLPNEVLDEQIIAIYEEEND